MHSSRLIILIGTATLFAQISVGTVSGANLATTPSSTPAPALSVSNATSTGAPSTARNIPSSTTSSTTPHANDDDCSDEVAEPEPGATSDNRQGKQISLNDKDKYSHENGTAEPEPENSVNDKLTGNNTTTKAPAVGSASGKEVYSIVLGIAVAVCLSTTF